MTKIDYRVLNLALGAEVAAKYHGGCIGTYSLDTHAYISPRVLIRLVKVLGQGRYKQHDN